MTRALRLAAACAVVAGCGPSRGLPARRPMSASEHHAEARSHDREAADHTAAAVAAEQGSAASEIYCADRTIAEQSTSGGVPISLDMPCWTTSHGGRDAHLRRAHELRIDARRHRAIAATLIAAKRAACDRLPPDERDHSPSWHRGDIVAVEPIRDAGGAEGARVVFRKVKGLTAAWLRDAYACHQAEAAVEGYDPTFMAYCPAALEDVTIDVVERTDGFAVIMRSDRREIAAAVLGRATDLIEETP